MVILVFTCKIYTYSDLGGHNVPVYPPHCHGGSVWSPPSLNKGFAKGSDLPHSHHMYQLGRLLHGHTWQGGRHYISFRPGRPHLIGWTS